MAQYPNYFLKSEMLENLCFQMTFYTVHWNF